MENLAAGARGIQNRFNLQGEVPERRFQATRPDGRPGKQEKTGDKFKLRNIGTNLQARCDLGVCQAAQGHKPLAVTVGKREGSPQTSRMVTKAPSSKMHE